MKNYRLLITLGIVVLMALSVFSMLSSSAEEIAEFNSILAEARNFRDQKLYAKASEAYQKVISMDDDMTYYLEVIDMYYDADLDDACMAWCENAMDQFPSDSRGYDRMIRVCLKVEDYEGAYVVLDEADGRSAKSEVIELYREAMKYLAEEDYFTGSNVKAVSGSVAAFEKKELWGLCNVKGKTVVSAKFKAVSYFANGVVAVLADDDNWYFMDQLGDFLHNISLNVPGEITEVGLYNNDVVPICSDGVYKYYDLSFNEKFGEYKFAGSFNQGVAAVKNANAWSLIDGNGNPLTNETYEDIALDERGVCAAGERIMVKKNGKYIMLDLSGNRVGSESFDEATIFANPYGAVCKNGLWGYVDSSCNYVIQPQYLEAKAFSCGLGAVRTNTGWGYVNEKNEMCIEAKYIDCKSFTSSGTAFVYDMGKWKVLLLYRLNHTSGN